jgi:hypothetical protein
VQGDKITHKKKSRWKGWKKQGRKASRGKCICFSVGDRVGCRVQRRASEVKKSQLRKIRYI